jgi:hypothetical protein
VSFLCRTESIMGVPPYRSCTFTSAWWISNSSLRTGHAPRCSLSPCGAVNRMGPTTDATYGSCGKGGGGEPGCETNDPFRVQICETLN